MKQSSPTDSSPSTRVSFERLRERTDELELLISGLALLALISLPPWLLATHVQYRPVMSIELLGIVAALIPVSIAVCYSIAAMLLAHLALRAYWVGLIGLKSAFPQGVNWGRLRGVGTLVKRNASERLGDVASAIERADRRASALFSLVVYTAISVLVIGAWLLSFFLLAVLFGPMLGGTEFFSSLAVVVLLLVLVCAPMLLWFFDGVLARFFTSLPTYFWFRFLIAGLFFLERLFFPLRLVGVSRYTLQSNTLPRTFFLFFIAFIVFALWLSNSLFHSHGRLDVFGSHIYAEQEALLAGHNSRHYESQISESRRLAVSPMIPQPVVQAPWLPLFLPYRPVVDDPILKQRCTRNDQSDVFAPTLGRDDSDAVADARDRDVDELEASASACLAKIWLVKLNGVVQPLDSFVVSERLDLGRRGLTGYLPLHGLREGPHRLEVFWRPSPEQDRLNNDIFPPRRRYVIPFVWSPSSGSIGPVVE